MPCQGRLAVAGGVVDMLMVALFCFSRPESEHAAESSALLGVDEVSTSGMICSWRAYVEFAW